TPAPRRWKHEERTGRVAAGSGGSTRKRHALPTHRHGVVWLEGAHSDGVGCGSAHARRPAQATRASPLALGVGHSATVAQDGARAGASAGTPPPASTRAADSPAWRSRGPRRRTLRIPPRGPYGVAAPPSDLTPPARPADRLPPAAPGAAHAPARRT